MNDVIEGLFSEIEGLRKRIEKREAYSYPEWVYLTTPLTSTSWDGDSFSTTAKTAIDLSAVFAAPAGITAILVEVTVRDSGSSGADCYLILSPNDTAGSGPHFRCSGLANDAWASESKIIPCNASGDVYYEVAASGATTFDVIIDILGYYV